MMNSSGLNSTEDHHWKDDNWPFVIQNDPFSADKFWNGLDDYLRLTIRKLFYSSQVSLSKHRQLSVLLDSRKQVQFIQKDCHTNGKVNECTMYFTIGIYWGVTDSAFVQARIVYPQEKLCVFTPERLLYIYSVKLLQLHKRLYKRLYKRKTFTISSVKNGQTRTKHNFTIGIYSAVNILKIYIECNVTVPHEGVVAYKIPVFVFQISY